MGALPIQSQDSQIPVLPPSTLGRPPTPGCPGPQSTAQENLSPAGQPREASNLLQLGRWLSGGAPPSCPKGLWEEAKSGRLVNKEQ